MSSPNYKYGTGLSNVGSYQVSGKPFASAVTVPASGAAATPAEINFPTVTKEITLTHDGDTGKHVRVAFSSNGLQDTVNNYVLVPPGVDGGVVTLNVKATDLYIMCHDGTSDIILTAYGALTGISPDRITNVSPSGSNWSGSVGIG